MKNVGGGAANRNPWAYKLRAFAEMADICRGALCRRNTIGTMWKIVCIALLSLGYLWSASAQEYLPPKIGSGGKKAAPEPTLPANYDFSYDVQDNAVSLDFGHSEKRKDDSATGSYHVLLPDGRMQLVEYEAGPDGYKPQIMYMGTATFPAAGGGGGGDKFDGYHYNAASNRQSVRQAAPRGAARQPPPPAPAPPPAHAPSNTTQ